MRFLRITRNLLVCLMCATLIYVAKHTATILQSKPKFRRFSDFLGSLRLVAFKTLAPMGFETSGQVFTGNNISNTSSTCLPFEIQLERVKRGPFGIPMIIHQIYMSNNLPPQYMNYLTKCRNLNQDFVHVLWTDNDFMQFLKLKRQQWLPLFKQFTIGIEKSDVMRLMITQHYGGFYLDMDVECFRPLSDYLKSIKVPLLFDQERNLQSVLQFNVSFISMNSVIVSRPGHPFLQQLIDKLPSRVPLKSNAVYKTGPFFILPLYKEYVKRKLKLEDQTAVASPDHFSPILDHVRFHDFNRRCQTANFNGSSACKEWLGQGRKQNETHEIIVRRPFLVHRFLHLGYASKANKQKWKTRDVCKTDLKVSRFSGNQTAS